MRIGKISFGQSLLPFFKVDVDCRHGLAHAVASSLYTLSHVLDPIKSNGVVHSKLIHAYVPYLVYLQSQKASKLSSRIYIRTTVSLAPPLPLRSNTSRPYQAENRYSQSDHEDLFTLHRPATSPYPLTGLPS